MPRERCRQCGFDSDLYDRADTVSSQVIVPAILRAAIEAMDEPYLHRRPDAATWSIAEYIDHVRETAFGNRFAIESALENPGVDLGDPPTRPLGEAPRAIDHVRALAGVEREYRSMQDLLASLDDPQWDATVTVAGEALPVGWFARHVVHDGLHHVADIGRIRHRFGQGATRQSGSVHQISVSGGGVPKLAAPKAYMNARGLADDLQADRRHHGRPVQAVSLWSKEVIDSLVAQGHPIGPGSAGENITIAGIEWAELRPGSLLHVGSIPLWITAYAIPCAKNARWFSDRDFNRILHDRNPGMSRLYAIPLGAGQVTIGDRVTVEKFPPTIDG